MFKKLLLVIVVLVAGFAGYVALQPNDFRISRSATMAASPAAVFAQVNDFHNWNAWSPWAKLDPNAKNTFEGPASGEGAVFRWAGNAEVGEGHMRILESKPNERIRLELGFEKPMQDTSDVEFTFKPVGDKTELTWTMSGEHTFVSKAMCTLMNMEKMLGGQFDQGLENIKQIVEAKPAAAAASSTAPATPTGVPANPTGGAVNAAEPPDPVGAFKK